MIDAVRGNFPGAEWQYEGIGVIPCIDNERPYSVATASNIPAEKSEKFISQTIEKLLDGVIPTEKKKEYTIVLLATPISNIEERKLRIGAFYTGLAPFASWQTNFTYTETNSTSSTASFGVNLGASAGAQTGRSQSSEESKSETDTYSTTKTHTEEKGITTTKSKEFHADAGIAASASSTVGSVVQTGLNVVLNVGLPILGMALGGSAGSSIAKSIVQGISGSLGVGVSFSKSKADTSSSSDSTSEGFSKSNTIGNSTSTGESRGNQTGVNFGVNFARSSTVTATIGKNEGITQSFTNFNIKHALEILEKQMERMEQSTALGMWDFAAYVLSEDYDVANNVAHSYLALTLGEESYMSKSAINSWRGTVDEERDTAKEIAGYIRQLRHPIFALNPDIADHDMTYNVYPPIITATTSLSGKELAYSLNFPQKSVSGLPVLECAEFSRNVVTYSYAADDTDKLDLGRIFHMNHEENTTVSLEMNSLASHTFITGSTGSGKSNTIYRILDRSRKNGVKFLVIEPAKGEYKHVFGNQNDVYVYGTNQYTSPLLRINPFSFPREIHILEHLDRLVEIFNVCWPMYAAMPAVLKNAIEKSYTDCGWDLTESENIYGENLYPDFSDVTRNIRTIIDKSEYDSENKGAYKGSLITRLTSLSNGINGLIFTENEISAEELFENNVIIDLSRIGSNETKSLIMGMLVLKLQEYRMSHGGMNAQLKHITVLEEAHNILKRQSVEQVSESANLLGKSVEMISNAIAEMRTYGEGFIIADQSPGLLDMSAIRNTNTKIIMRLPDITDRELVGKAANLNENQITELAKLPCGVSAIYQNEWIAPVLCKIEKYNTPEGLYEYHYQKYDITHGNSGKMIDVAKLLSNGSKVTRETILKDIVPLLRDNGIKASACVAISKYMENPPREPRMTKLAPIMAELFPGVKAAVVSAYNDNHDVSEWTRSAENALTEIIGCEIDDQVRRDIIQAVITEYVYNELGKYEDMRNWSENGGLI